MKTDFAEIAYLLSKLPQEVYWKVAGYVMNEPIDEVVNVIVENEIDIDELLEGWI